VDTGAAVGASVAGASVAGASVTGASVAGADVGAVPPPHADKTRLAKTSMLASVTIDFDFILSLLWQIKFLIQNLWDQKAEYGNYGLLSSSN
jgi:hypothetical protein